MNKKDINVNESIKVETITKKYKQTLDFDLINNSIVATNNQDLGKISKTTINNIAKWALNGASNREIANNLELSEKQFKVLCNICPALVFVMQESRELADIYLASSLFQRAIGGQKITKQQAVKVGDYEGGVKVGEHVEIVDLVEELPPDSNLLKFMAENKLSEKFGKDKVNEDTEISKVVGQLDLTKLGEIEDKLNQKSENNEN